MSELIGDSKVMFPLNKERNSSFSNQTKKENLEKLQIDEIGVAVADSNIEQVLIEFDSEEEFVLSDDEKVLFETAESLYRNGQDFKAYEYYIAFVGSGAYHPEYLFSAFKNIGNIKVRSGDFEGAEEFYHKAFTINPLSDVLLVNLGTLEIQKSQFEKALYRFRQAVEINPLNSRGWIGLAIAHREYGDLELAWGNLEKALDINTSEETALELAVQWGIKDGKIDSLLQRMNSYLLENPDDMHMRAQLARVLIIGGRLNPAKSCLENSLKKDPKHQELIEISQSIAKTLSGV
jgi:tetratricopeptide (TPR) repeat protein